MTWKPKKNKQKYLDRAKEVADTYERTGNNLEETARVHWFRDVRSVYRYLKLAGYKLPKRQRDERGRYLPSKNFNEE